MAGCHRGVVARAVVAKAFVVVAVAFAFVVTVVAEVDLQRAQAQTAGLTLTPPTLVANFGPVVLSGGPQTATASMSTFVVSDLTASGAGWHVTVAATQLCQQATPAVCASPSPRTLPVGSLDHSAPTVTGAAPQPTVSAPTGIDGSSAKLVSAAAGTGAGTYTFGASTLTLRIPPTAYAATYFTTVTYTIASGP